MRAIQLSLLQHSTPVNQQSRQSSSSSSSAGSSRDQAQSVQGQQDLSIFSADSASLQKAIELSLQDSAVPGSDRIFVYDQNVDFCVQPSILVFNN